MRVRMWACLILLILLPVGARAAEQANKLPSLFSVGAGWFDVFKREKYSDQGEFRLEYRSGLSLLSATNENLTPTDRYFQLHPFGGIETTLQGSLYGFGGLIFDFLLGRSFVFSPSFAVGAYSQGAGKRLGSTVEFRSTLEAGFRLPNEMRLTAYCSHISNGNLTVLNPGAEMIGAYWHLPLP